MLSDKNTHTQEPAPRALPALVVGTLHPADCFTAEDGGSVEARPSSAALSLTACRSWQFETNPEDRA